MENPLAKCIGTLVVFVFTGIGCVIFLIFSILASIKGWGNTSFGDYEDD